MTSRVILQPAGDGDASAHYVDTIAHPVALNRVKPFVSDGFYKNLKDLYPLDVAPIWGVVPGVKGVNANKWKRIDTGDIALFSKENRIFSSAVVTIKDHNQKLALELWRKNSKGETWEYLYFLDQLKPQSIPYPIFNKAAGYKSNNIIRGFNVLKEGESSNVIVTFNLGSDVYYPEVTKNEFDDALKVLADHLGGDKQVLTAARTEQNYLRRYLFKNKHHAICGICGRELPVTFLTAAHIKKRSRCTLEERRDVTSIVMPMCRLGCDELFEQGYICVDNRGCILITDLPGLPIAITEYFQLLKGRQCSHWSPSSKKYFEWHKDNAFDLI